MTDPVTLTTATLVALAASKFVESAASKAGEVATPLVLQKASGQIDQLWQRIKQHFAGNKRAETAISEVETQQSEAALIKLEVYMDDDLSEPQNQPLKQDLQQIAQKIINIGEQKQTQKSVTITVNAQDEARVNAVGEVNATTVNFGDT